MRVKAPRAAPIDHGPNLSGTFPSSKRVGSPRNRAAGSEALRYYGSGVAGSPVPCTPEPCTPEPCTPEPCTPEPCTPEPCIPEPLQSCARRAL